MALFSLKTALVLLNGLTYSTINKRKKWYNAIVANFGIYGESI